MFCPPPPKKFLTTGPPKMGASGQNFCQIASEHPEMCKIFDSLNYPILENTRGLGKKYHDLYLHIYSAQLEFMKVLYKGAV